MKIPKKHRNFKSFSKETIKFNLSKYPKIYRTSGNLKLRKVIQENWSKYGFALDFESNTDVDVEGFNSLSIKEKYESKIFKAFGSKGKYYHITSPKNWMEIKESGLRGGHKAMTPYNNSNKIWAIESDYPEIWNTLALNQLTEGVENLPVVVIEIDPSGITGEVLGEDGGELIVELHTVIHQSFIDKKHLKYVGTFMTNERVFIGMRDTLLQIKHPDLANN